MASHGLMIIHFIVVTMCLVRELMASHVPVGSFEVQHGKCSGGPANVDTPPNGAFSLKIPSDYHAE